MSFRAHVQPVRPWFRADPYPFYDRLREGAGARLAVRLRRAHPLRGRRPHAAGQRVLPRHRGQRPTTDYRCAACAASGCAGAGSRATRPRTSSSSTPLTTPGCAGSSRSPSRPRRSSGCGPGSRRSSTHPRTRRRPRLDGARRRARLPRPFQVISDLLGMPTEREDELRDWSQTLTAALEPTADEDDARPPTPRGAAGRYLDDVIADRRGHLGEDLLSQLLVVEEEGDRLSPAELLSFVILLYVAGHETTVNLIGNGVSRCCATPTSCAAGATTRRSTPRRSTSCCATTDRSSRRCAYRYSRSATATSTSPRDDRHDRPRRGEPRPCDVRRSGRRCASTARTPTATSRSPPACTTASAPSLAKLEATVALTSVIRRFPDLELAGEPHWRDRLTIRGVDRLPARVVMR